MSVVPQTTKTGPVGSLLGSASKVGLRAANEFQGHCLCSGTLYLYFRPNSHFGSKCLCFGSSRDGCENQAVLENACNACSYLLSLFIFKSDPPPIPTPPGVLSGRVLKNPVTEINKSRSGHRATLISVCSISISPAPVFFPTRVRGPESQKEKHLPSETESSFSVTSSAT